MPHAQSLSIFLFVFVEKLQLDLQCRSRLLPVCYNLVLFVVNRNYHSLFHTNGNVFWIHIDMVKWHHSNLWSRYDLHIVRHYVAFREVNWWFVMLFKQNWICRVKKCLLLAPDQLSHCTIRYDTIDLRALKSWRDGQLNLAHGPKNEK